MNNSLPFSLFSTRFADDDLCLEEIKKSKYPDGVFCEDCKRFTKHYRVTGRKSYACKYCRHQVYPLGGTIFEKSSTSLRVWFYAMFLMTHTRGNLTITQLQRELGVTYKTAWRIYRGIFSLMEQNKGDLLGDKAGKKIHKWMFFNKIELKVVHKQDTTE